MIDGLVFWPLDLLLLWTQRSAGFPVVGYLGFVIDETMFFVYSIAMHGYFGQTIGKWIMRVKVISVDGSRLSMRQALLRDSVPLVLVVIYVLLGPDADRAGGWGRFLANVSIIWFVLEIVSMLTNDKRRAIHDFIAGSVVVRLPRA